MCGIAGFLDTSRSSSSEQLTLIARRMATSLRHRGPEDEGIWVDPNTGIAFGHRRLSIIDLSPMGHQPMHSASGRYVITFNGEIYNFKALRQELEQLGETFRGHSDTEIMLAAIARWGVEASLKKFNGMFAFGLWDREERTLYLSRDRAGEKPLYYGWAGKTLLFGSELKALQQHPDFRGDIDRGAIAVYLRHNYIPAPHSIYKGIYKLPPGTFLTIRGFGTDASPKPYWSAKVAAENGIANPFSGTEEEAVNQLDELLNDAVTMRMEADVPLGAFLSGGIDSSLIVAIMQANSRRPVKTFTIGFDNREFNEAESAKLVAQHIGTEHTELYVTPEEAMAVIPRLPMLYDEPFADSSQIPTFLVAQLARRDVTVALSGDGGDELFGGYNRYLWAESLWKWLSPVSGSGRRFLASALDRTRPEAMDRHAHRFANWLPEPLRHRMTGEKLHKLADVLRAPDEDALFLRLLSTWNEPGQIVGVEEPQLPLLGRDRPPLAHLTERMMCTDALLYLPDDILVKVDRATMGVSLEGRVPMLDPAVATFACSLPRRLKIRGSKGKWALRSLLARYVPTPLFERPKMGFAVPVGDWLRGPLGSWAEAELDESRLADGGYFNPAPIREVWRQHVEGRQNLHRELWAILMFQAWQAEWGSRSAPTRPVSPTPPRVGHVSA